MVCKLLVQRRPFVVTTDARGEREGQIRWLGIDRARRRRGRLGARLRARLGARSIEERGAFAAVQMQGVEQARCRIGVGSADAALEILDAACAESGALGQRLLGEAGRQTMPPQQSWKGVHRWRTYPSAV